VTWERFLRHYLACPSIGMALDVSAMSFPDDFFDARYAWSPPSSS